MDYLKWILRCIEWQTYGECKIEAEVQNWPFKIALKRGDESYDKVITPERIMIVLNDDNAMKALLEEIKVLFKIKKEQALFRIYAEQKAWPGKISMLISNINK